MTQQRLAFKPGEKPRLELDWGTYMRDFEIRLDGEEIGRIDGGQRALKEPHLFTLPDGSELSIRLKQNQLMDELEVLRDGQPLPGSASSPNVKLSASIRYAFYWGLAAIVAGIFLLVSSSGNLVTLLTFTTSSVAFGIGLLVTAVAMSRGSRIATFVAPLLFIADWVLGFNAIRVSPDLNFNFLSTVAMVARFMSLMFLIQGARPQGSRELQGALDEY